MNSAKDLLNAKATNIIVFNVVPLQSIPANSILNQPQVFGGITLVSNIAVNASLQALQTNYTQSSISLFNLNSFITNLLNSPPSPITNTVNNCWDNGNVTTVIKYCTDPTKYFFVDKLHFSSTVQKALADTVGEFFNIGFIPSPSNYFYTYTN